MTRSDPDTTGLPPGGSAVAPLSGADIALLPARVAEQIAAGEVIDRPASVVRELVDNALDAGASRVDVALVGGGRRSIRVSDDGRGMTPAEARLALERHATSKLRQLDDLLRTRTLGFRGEGLTSVAVVSRLTIQSRRRGAAEGCEIQIDGGRIVEQRPVGCAEGTTVEARELFYNVPARRKFLKTTATEAALVSELIERKALACCPVRFELSLEGRSALSLAPTADRRERVRATLRLDGGELQSTQRSEPGLSVEVHLTRPQRTISSSRGLRLIVNGRPIRDRALLTAVLRGAEGRLARGRFPLGVVYVDVDPSVLDINVHPQKSEVRFAQPRRVFELLQTTVAQLFGGASPRRSAEAQTPRSSAASSTSARPALVAFDDETAKPEGMGRSYRLGAGGASRASEGQPQVPDGSGAAAPLAYLEQRTRIAEATRRFWAEQPESDDPEDFGLSAALGQLDSPESPTEPAPKASERPVVVGRSSAGLLIVEHRDELFVVDPLAATRRLLQRTLREQLGSAGALSCRELSPPRPVEKALAKAVADRRAVLEALGFELEDFGAGRQVLRGAPAALGEVSPAGLLELLATLAPQLPKTVGQATLGPLVDQIAQAAALDPAPEQELLDAFAALGPALELRAVGEDDSLASAARWRLPRLAPPPARPHELDSARPESRAGLPSDSL
jgi:DNA mismatch repair protein MutL